MSEAKREIKVEKIKKIKLASQARKIAERRNC